MMLLVRCGIRIFSQSGFQTVQGLSKIGQIKDIGQSDLIHTQSFRSIETISGSEHNGFVPESEIGQQPFTKMLGIIYRQFGKNVKCSLWFIKGHLGNFRQSFYDVSSSGAVYTDHRIHEFFRRIDDFFSVLLSQYGWTQPELSVLQNHISDLAVAGNDTTNTSTTGLVSFANRIENDDPVLDVFHLQHAVEFSFVTKFPVYFVYN